MSSTSPESGSRRAASPGKGWPPLSFVRLSTQFENAGDCLINRELVRLISERGDVCLDVSRSPSQFARQVVTAVHPHRSSSATFSFFVDMVLARLRGRDCYWFLMPGAVTGTTPTTNRGRVSLRDVALMVASWLGVRTCQVGVSFGELTEEQVALWRRRRRWLFRLCPRDSTSQTYLESRGIRCDTRIPDLSFNIFRAAPVPEAAPVGYGARACLSFRTDQYGQQAADVKALAEAVCRNTAATTRWRVVVQVARDRRGMAALHEHLRTMGFMMDPLVDVHADVEACLDSYRGAALVVSNRLHVLLMAASRGARIIALTHGPGGRKLEGVLRDLGLEAAIVDNRHPDRVGTCGMAGMTISGVAERDRLRQAFDDLLGPTPGSTAPH